MTKRMLGFLRCSLIALVLIALSASPAFAKKGKSALLPGNANFRGMSLEEWSFAWTHWQIATGLGGEHLSDTIDKVRFLRGAFAPGEYEFNVTVRPGTAFAFPAFFVFGERYDDPSVPDDDPVVLADLLDLIFETTYVEMRLNGEVVLSDPVSELDQFGPLYFDEPIPYAEPQPRGEDLNSVAALWATGMNALLHPLPAGRHTLQTTVVSEFFGVFEYTHHIRVVPGGR